MYTTYFLRFATQEEAEQKLTEVGYSSTDPETDQIHFHTPPHTGALDIIGTIYNNDGVYDEESGEVVTPPTAMEGYHVNLILKEKIPTSLKTYIVYPNLPYRVFA